MKNLNVEEEFNKIQKQIEEYQKNGKDITNLLKAKVRLLKIGYEKLSDNIENGKLKKLAPIFAQELAFLNNIKKIQTNINESVEETDMEIEKVHAQMRENGFAWILENLPEKKN